MRILALIAFLWVGFDEYTNKMKNKGWEVQLAPDSTEDFPATIVDPGASLFLRTKQKIVLTYSWGITSSHFINKNKKRFIRSDLLLPDTFIVKFAIGQRDQKIKSLHVSQNPSINNLSDNRVMYEVKTDDSEEKIILNLQQRLQVCSSLDTTNILETFYLANYSDATLIRQSSAASEH